MSRHTHKGKAAAAAGVGCKGANEGPLKGLIERFGGEEESLSLSHSEKGARGAACLLCAALESRQGSRALSGLWSEFHSDEHKALLAAKVRRAIKHCVPVGDCGPGFTLVSS